MQKNTFFYVKVLKTGIFLFNFSSDKKNLWNKNFFLFLLLFVWLTQFIELKDD